MSASGGRSSENDRAKPYDDGQQTADNRGWRGESDRVIEWDAAHPVTGYGLRVTVSGWREASERVIR